MLATTRNAVRKRKIRKMFVIDRIELVVLRSVAAGAETRATARPAGLSSVCRPATKSLRSGTCASTLLASIKSAAPSARRKLSCRPLTRRKRLRVGTRRTSGPPSRNSRPARRPGRECRGRRNSAADSRRCWPPRQPRTSGQARGGSPPFRRSCGRGLANCRRRTKNRNAASAWKCVSGVSKSAALHQPAPITNKALERIKPLAQSCTIGPHESI